MMFYDLLCKYIKIHSKGQNVKRGGDTRKNAH